MKSRLKKIASGSNQEIAQLIFDLVKEFYTWDEQLVQFTKDRLKKTGYTVDELKEDEYDAGHFFSGIVTQHQGIYDAVSDRFFIGPNGEIDDVTVPGSKARIQIDNIVENIDKYINKGWQALLDDASLVQKIS